MDDTEVMHRENVVVFELASRGSAASLYLRLVSRREAWRFQLGDTWFVTAEVEEGDDLAVLLRDVERWVAAECLRAIRYWVDDRDYVLESGDVAWSALSLAA
ncbi:MAG TPA: hypothetical protein VHC67_03515 [Gaiellaceae bacterium]|jgi:hypothetical protein|nr:hypothetical protein [Gaiellaceae bacterium]